MSDAQPPSPGSVDLRQLVDKARVEALRRQHAAVTPEHLLAAVIHENVIHLALAERGLDAVELRERLDERLASRPNVGGYRDGGPLPLSATSERVLERLLATSSGWGRHEPSVLDILFLEPWIASLVVGLRHCRRVAGMIERAVALAVIESHPHVTVEHVLAIMLRAGSFVEAIASAGGNAATLGANLARWADAQPRVEELAGRPLPDRELTRSMAEPPLIRFRLMTLRSPAIGALLAGSGADAFDVMYGLVHRSLPPGASLADSVDAQYVDVVAHHDEATSDVEKASIIQAAFLFHRPHVAEVVLAARAAGSAVIDTQPRERAIERCVQAHELMRSVGTPLRLTLRNR